MMGGMKDAGGQQSRFKWMMEGQSPAPSPPTTTFHKNGRCNRWIEIQFLQFTLGEQTPLRPLRTVSVLLNALIITFIHSQSESLLIRSVQNIFMSICVTLFSFSNDFFKALYPVV